jgi:DNA-directed RNA polymerase subunit RPC12/RpoP
VIEVDGIETVKQDGRIHKDMEDAIRRKFEESKIKSSSEILSWLEADLPDLEDFPDMTISASELDPRLRRLLLLSDDETIFLVFGANTELPKGELDSWIVNTPTKLTSPLLLFTSEKLLALNPPAGRLFNYAMLLKHSELDNTEKEFIEDTIQQRLQTYEKSKLILAYPIVYDAIYDISISGSEVLFRRTDRSPALHYKVRLLSTVAAEKLVLSSGLLGKRAFIRMVPYPSNEETKKKLLSTGHACEYSSGKVWFSSYVNLKLFLGSLKRIPNERRKITDLLSKIRDAKIIEIPNKESALLQLKCSNCGSGNFKTGIGNVKTTDGEVSLLRCEYCGQEGVISRKATAYEIAFSKPSNHQ